MKGAAAVSVTAPVPVEDVLAHLRGEDDPRVARGFETLEEANLATYVLEVVREYEKTEEGPFVLGVLRSFHGSSTISSGPVGTSSKKVPNQGEAARRREKHAREQRGLAELYVWLCSLDDEPCLDADVLAKRFAQGEEKEARYKAAETYATCVLRLDAWMTGEDWDAGRYR